MKSSLVIAPLLLVVACSKGGTEESKKSTAPAVTIDPAAVNALVPADLKAKFEFVEQTIEMERGKKSSTKFTFAGPKSWKRGDMKMFADIQPPSGEGFGNFTKMSFSSNCDGACQPKDWKATADKVEFKQYTDNAQFKVIKDEAGPNNRLVIADSDTTRYATYAWWTEGASQYFACRAALDKGFHPDSPDPRPAIDAFAAACKAVRIEE